MSDDHVGRLSTVVSRLCETWTIRGSKPILRRLASCSAAIAARCWEYRFGCRNRRHGRSDIAISAMMLPPTPLPFSADAASGSPMTPSTVTAVHELPPIVRSAARHRRQLRRPLAMGRSQRGAAAGSAQRCLAPPAAGPTGTAPGHGPRATNQLRLPRRTNLSEVESACGQ